MASGKHIFLKASLFCFLSIQAYGAYAISGPMSSAPPSMQMPKDGGEMAGVGMASMVATGYGLYAVTMQASACPGAISDFYMYSQNGAYPARWHEIDLEFTPGFISNPSPDPNHPHSLATGTCYNSAASDNLPDPAKCTMSPFTNISSGNNPNLSFNIYSHQAIDNQPYSYSNTQVFMAPTPNSSIFTQYYTYYIYYTPKGVYWTLNQPETALTQQPPKTLVQPSFVKKDYTIVQNNSNWKGANGLGFSYDGAALTPVLADKTLADTGALMNISMNIWDGSTSGWGGNTPPAAGCSSSYKYVAFYPLQTPVAQVGSDPTKLEYGSATIFSDFTSANGNFMIDGKKTTFGNLWQVSNGSYLYPLGQLDERNIICGSGNLTLQISTPYSSARPNNQADPCAWLNIN